MINLAICYSVYLFLCYFMGADITPEGVFMPLITWSIISCYAEVCSQNVMNIYISKDNVEKALKEMDDEQA